jgi:hypothetical protein
MKRWMQAVSVAVMVSAVQAAIGGEVSVFILPDRGIDSNTMSRLQIKQRNQIGQWWEQDMALLLAERNGYETQIITSREEFTPGPGKYLLTNKILRYHAGSKVARMYVGYGVGSANMDVHYELFGEGKDPILVKTDGCGTSRDWRNACRKLNENLVKALRGAIK